MTFDATKRNRFKDIVSSQYHSNDKFARMTQACRMRSRQSPTGKGQQLVKEQPEASKLQAEHKKID